MMFYAIGDIHGCFDLLQNLHTQILDDISKNPAEKATIVFLGDYVDRGKKSKEVCDFLMALKDSDQIRHVILKGNHEDLMYKSYSGTESWAHSVWLGNGGGSTLRSFNVCRLPYSIRGSEVLKPYAEWMNALPTYFETPEYVFCHSGYIDYESTFSADFAPLAEQEAQLLWGRPDDGRYEEAKKWVVHGHTPTLIRPHVELHKINVDVGACYPDSGMLYCAILPDSNCTVDSVRFLYAQ
jgi:serine/threonine protein phosphatase 1